MTDYDTTIAPALAAYHRSYAPVVTPAKPKDVDYVTGGRKALSDPMANALIWVAAKDHDVRSCLPHYQIHAGTRTRTGTWAALVTRGLVTPGSTPNSHCLTAEGVRALLQFGIPADLRQAVLDEAHVEALEMNAAFDRQVELAEECAECTEDSALVLPEGWQCETCGRPRKSATPVPGPEVAADALLDDRMTEEIPDWGTEPEHAVQAVWAHRNLTGMAPTREVLTRPRTRDMVDGRAIDGALKLGWLECLGADADAQYATYRVTDRVRNLAMLRAAERHKYYAVAVADSRVITRENPGFPDEVYRLTIGTRITAEGRRWVFVRQIVSPDTLELRVSGERAMKDEDQARYELGARTSAYLGWGWCQAFRRTGDGVTTY